MPPSDNLEPNATAFPSLIIADDHALVRRVVRAEATQLLPQTVALEVSDVRSLLRTAGASPQHRLAVVSAAMAGCDTKLLQELAALCPMMPIVVISCPASPRVVDQLLRISTVRAALSKDAEAHQLRFAMEAALRGRTLHHLRPLPLEPQQAMLTERQREVYQLMCEGMSNHLIAQALNISTGTVKNHLSVIFKALHASNRTHAARLAPRFEASIRSQMRRA